MFKFSYVNLLLALFILTACDESSKSVQSYQMAEKFFGELIKEADIVATAHYISSRKIGVGELATKFEIDHSFKGQSEGIVNVVLVENTNVPYWNFPEVLENGKYLIVASNPSLKRGQNCTEGQEPCYYMYVNTFGLYTFTYEHNKVWMKPITGKPVTTKNNSYLPISCNPESCDYTEKKEKANWKLFDNVTEKFDWISLYEKIRFNWFDYKTCIEQVINKKENECS